MFKRTFLFLSLFFLLTFVVFKGVSFAVSEKFKVVINDGELTIGISTKEELVDIVNKHFGKKIVVKPLKEVLNENKEIIKKAYICSNNGYGCLFEAFYIGMYKKDVLKLLGKPDEEFENSIKYISKGVLFHFDETKRVVAIETEMLKYGIEYSLVKKALRELEANSLIKCKCKEGRVIISKLNKCYINFIFNSKKQLTKVLVSLNCYNF